MTDFIAKSSLVLILLQNHHQRQIICVPEYSVNNKMNLFRLLFVLFILKWSAGKGYCYITYTTSSRGKYN